MSKKFSHKLYKQFNATKIHPLPEVLIEVEGGISSRAPFVFVSSDHPNLTNRSK